MENLQETKSAFYADIRNIIIEAKSNAVRGAEYVRMMMYWRLGERIFIEEQHAEERAEYGDYLIKNLAESLEREFGNGFSSRQLAYCRKFYRTYPNEADIRKGLNWFQYRLLSSIDDDYKREYYELEASNHSWTGRELERQINSLLYERLLMSNDK